MPGPERVVVLRAPDAPALRGPGGDRLADLLLARALAWARAAFGDEAVSPSLQDGAGVPAPAPADAGPLVLVLPVLPAWRPELAAEALDDLAAGCAVTVGAGYDGGAYLLAIAGGARPPELGLETFDWTDRDAPARLMLAAGPVGAEVGMLRIERGLRTAADVRAVLADPLCDDELREVLGGSPASWGEGT